MTFIFRTLVGAWLLGAPDVKVVSLILKETHSSHPARGCPLAAWIPGGRSVGEHVASFIVCDFYLHCFPEKWSVFNLFWAVSLSLGLKVTLGPPKWGRTI